MTEERKKESHDTILLITLKLLLTLVKQCEVQFPTEAAATFTALRDGLGTGYFLYQYQLLSLYSVAITSLAIVLPWINARV